MDYTISDLKKTIGNGLFANKYLLEMYSPIASMNASKLNLLCKSAKFPERTISTADVWRLGRKYNVRGETRYGDTMTLTFVEDDTASVREFFDTWLKLVDDSGTASVLDTSSYESAISTISSISSGTEAATTNLIKSTLDADYASAVATYQSDVSVWSLNNEKTKVYGYKYQNCYPTGISSVEFTDESQNKLVEFEVTFTFSEFAPLSNTSALETVVDTALGDIVSSSITMEDLFE